MLDKIISFIFLFTNIMINKMLIVVIPMTLLLTRFWVGKVFLFSGLDKIHHWQATLSLFQYEYHVPLLPPIFAAYLSTSAEVALPILLFLGLGGRILAFVLFVYNFICVISYPFLWTPAGVMGLGQHINWGLLLLFLFCCGMGKFSLDHLILRFLHKNFSCRGFINSAFRRAGKLDVESLFSD